VALLVRSWNVFHGNTKPTGRRAFLEEMIRLAAEGADVVCLQELPVWSLPLLGRWSGMAAAAERVARPLLPAPAARRATDLHHGLLRSALTGQANAILVSRALRIVDHEYVPLNRRRGRKRRNCGAVRIERESGRTLLVANLHASGLDAELDKAVGFVEALAQPGEPIVLAGDFNRRPRLDEYSTPGAGIDHILVRGASATPLATWPPERHSHNGRVLSDHAPVELTLDL
jgi:endonuclease/exonuclease/phosphatase family metal-dependent hydrolase